MTNTENKSLNEYERLMGKIQIIKKCNYDLDTINKFIKSRSIGNPSRAMHEYKKIMLHLEISSNEYQNIN